MELYQLRTFVTVAEQGHVTQAAEILHLSQPAVTAQIKALEEELELPLFERSAGGVRLTRAGGELLVTARELLQQARTLRDQAASLRGQMRGRLRLGTLLDAQLLRLGPLLARLRQRLPLVDIECRQGLAGDILNRVRKRELDAGFFFGENPYSTVCALPLQTLSFSVIAPARWHDQLAAGDWGRAGELPWLLPVSLSGYHPLTLRCWQLHNISPSKALEVDGESQLLELVAHDLGLALIREPLSAELPAGVMRWAPDCVQAPLSFIYAREDASSPLLNEVQAVMGEVWQTARP